MQRAYPLTYLSVLVAATRAQGHPARIVLRNTERFGLIHLYFAHGRLTHVQGHRETPLRSIEDLATWRMGTIRSDEVEAGAGALAADPVLETALDDALRALERQGAARAIPPVMPPAASLEPLQGRSQVFDFGASVPGTVAVPHTIGVTGLPPLGQTPASAEQPGSAGQAERLTDPQWQLLALAVHQVVEQATHLIGQPMAGDLMRRALARVGRVKPPLRAMHLDASSWLRLVASASLDAYTRFDVAEAIAVLLGNYEMRCASLVGPERAQGIIVAATLPLRNALAQIGLSIGPGQP